MRARFTASLLIAIALLFMLLRPAAAADGESVSSYRLGAGDLLNIQVLGEPELSRERVRLSDAGTISFPVLGELKVLGITVGDLERMITAGLKVSYLVDPRVTVTIQEYRPFYVTGQVSKPGPYAYVPGLNVRKAVTLAGGLKERADPNKIFIIRDGDRGQTPQKVNLGSAVNPGDIITVEESFF